MACRTALLVVCMAALVLAWGGDEDGDGEVVVIAWENFTQTQKGEWMIEFYAPWCPACSQFESDWTSLAYRMDDYAVKIAKVDISTQTMLSGRFTVTHLPSVFHITDGDVRFYEGERNVNDLMEYIREKKWKTTEPIPYWRSPTAPHMYVVGGLFWVSEVAKGWQETLEKDYNVPTYGVFIILALATIVVGLTLGGITVCLIELCIRCCCASKPKTQQKPGTQKSKKQSEPRPTPAQEKGVPPPSPGQQHGASPVGRPATKGGSSRRRKRDNKGDK